MLDHPFSLFVKPMTNQIGTLTKIRLLYKVKFCSEDGITTLIRRIQPLTHGTKREWSPVQNKSI